MKKTECKGWNRISGKRCTGWAVKDGYCGPHAVAAKGGAVGNLAFTGEQANCTTEKHGTDCVLTPAQLLNWSQSRGHKDGGAR